MFLITYCILSLIIINFVIMLVNCCSEVFYCCCFLFLGQFFHIDGWFRHSMGRYSVQHVTVGVNAH